MSLSKNLNTGDFGDQIKMTLANNGNLGVGNTLPFYKGTFNGIVQGASKFPPNGLGVDRANFLVGGQQLRVGGSFWYGDVHLLLGQITGDGTNAGMIQVTAGDTSGKGSSIQPNIYNLNLQPGGGNVSIGVSTNASISKLNVGGNTRCDYDYLTGTDTPGWVYHQLQQYEVVQSLSGNWNSPGYPTLDLSGSSFNKAHVSYKIIGKTVFISFRFTWTGGSAWGVNSFGTHMKLPQLNFKDYNANNNTTMTGHGDSIGWVSSSPAMPMRVSLRKYGASGQTAPGLLNQWILVFDRADGGGGHNFPGATFSGQLIAELN